MHLEHTRLHLFPFLSCSEGAPMRRVTSCHPVVVALRFNSTVSSMSIRWNHRVPYLERNKDGRFGKRSNTMNLNPYQMVVIDVTIAWFGYLHGSNPSLHEAMDGSHNCKRMSSICDFEMDRWITRKKRNATETHGSCP